MGKNLIDSVNATKETVLFQKFQNGIQLWSRTGKEPEVGDQDIKYYLDLQEKRLKKYGMEMRITMEDGEEVFSAHRISVNTPILNWTGSSKFNKSNYFHNVHQTVEFLKDKERLDRQTDYITQYQTIIEPDPKDAHIGSTTYVCPNCGAISTVKELQETGCPFCGTHFMMKDLYPKVTNFYNLESPSLSDRQVKTGKKKIITGAAVLAFLYTVVYNFATDQFTWFTNLYTFVGAALLFGVLLYFGTSFFLMGRVLFKGIQSMPVVAGSAGSKNKITKKLKKYDPTFDYEYFEGKALSLARIIMFQDDPENCPQYRGTIQKDAFSDVLDIRYRGGIGVDDIKRQGEEIVVTLKLYLTNILYDGKKIRKKDETVLMEMRHDANFPVDQTFSIVKVNCPYCGGSFDARKKKCCPYCGKEYEAEKGDWVVTVLKR